MIASGFALAKTKFTLFAMTDFATLNPVLKTLKTGQGDFLCLDY
jgi:hypothetical protein